MDTQAILDDALNAALADYKSKMSMPFPASVRVAAGAEANFQAEVCPVGEAFLITVHRGVIETLIGFWERALQQPDLLLLNGQRIAAEVGDLVQGSLVWLIMHELSHIEMNHLSLTGGAGLTETGAAHGHGLVTHAVIRPAPLGGLTPAEQTAYRKCMELQADHEAVDMVIGNYAVIDPATIRTNAACIFAVMALIEVTDRKLATESKTHPGAAARLFQLAGHIFQLWAVRDAFSVRRQNIWHNSRRRLAECGPRLVVDVRRRACGAASADVRWSVA